jgi:hypothetical protein
MERSKFDREVSVWMENCADEYGRILPLVERGTKRRHGGHGAPVATGTRTPHVSPRWPREEGRPRLHHLGGLENYIRGLEGDVGSEPDRHLLAPRRPRLNRLAIGKRIGDATGSKT